MKGNLKHTCRVLMNEYVDGWIARRIDTVDSQIDRQMKGKKV